MRKLFMAVIAIVAASQLSIAQEIKELEVVITPSLQEEGELPYTGVPLTWDHFKGAPDNSCEFIAMTYSGIKMKYEYKSRNGKAQAKVLLCPYMDITQSWYKKEGHNDPTLAHEQRHFDITAIVARQFADEIKKRQFTVENFQKEMKILHKKYIDKLAKMQAEYDQETDHGIKTDIQSAWDKRLAEEVRKAMAES